MTIAERLILKRQRHLKWRLLDPLETVLMLLCGLLLFGFCTTVILDIITREIGRPWLWLQEVTTTFFIYAIFTGTAVATRRNVLGVALCFIYFGYLNFLRGFSSFRMPSMTPIASLYAAIPICGVLVALFTIEQLVNGLRKGFEHAEPPEPPPHVAAIEGIAPAPGGRR